MNEDGDPAISMSSHAEFCYFLSTHRGIQRFYKDLYFILIVHLMVGAMGTTFMDPSPERSWTRHPMRWTDTAVTASSIYDFDIPIGQLDP